MVNIYEKENNNIRFGLITFKKGKRFRSIFAIFVLQSIYTLKYKITCKQLQLVKNTCSIRNFSI